jgi:dihydrofolate reductase
MMNAPKKYVVSRTLERPVWRETTIIREDPMGFVRQLKAEGDGKILTDGSSQLVQDLLKHDLVDELHLLVYPIVLGTGKKILPEGLHQEFRLKESKTYPSGVVGLHYERDRE